MFWKSLLIFAAPKLNFIRGLCWFIAGLALGINSITFGIILLFASFVLNFFAARLELASAKARTQPERQQAVAAQSGVSGGLPDADMLLQMAKYFAKGNPPD